jgi:hypothetical protein
MAGVMSADAIAHDGCAPDAVNAGRTGIVYTRVMRHFVR